jgi:hypothetical protein
MAIWNDVEVVAKLTGSDLKNPALSLGYQGLPPLVTEAMK